jgi:hypothetical protein
MSFITVNSSAIRAVGYDGYTLVVIFHNSGRYDHPGVPEYVFHEFMNAPSLGRYYSRNIRSKYR